MSSYSVKVVVCDYGIYENDELKLIVNSKFVADTIVQLLVYDEYLHRKLNPQNYE